MRAFARLLAAAGALAAAAASAQDPAGRAPFLWTVAGPGVTHYIAGSVHLLPDAAHPLPDALEEAYEDTRELVLETDLAALGSAALQGKLLGAAREDREGGLKARIGKPLYDKLQRRAAQLGMPVPVCEDFRPWFCALALELFPLQQAGFTVENGLDNHFYARAREDGRPVIPLETARFQIDLFALMPEALSREMLAATLDESTWTSQSPAELFRTWRSGDVARVERLVADLGRSHPELHSRLLAQRNRAWVQPLVSRLRGEVPVLVVVGAAHLPGADGLLALLKAQGLAIEPAGTPIPEAKPPMQRAALAR